MTETSDQLLLSSIQLSDSQSRELSRVQRFLSFGSELNSIQSQRNSSFNAFFESFSERKTKIKQKSLKSVRNLWLSVQNQSQQHQKALALHLHRLIHAHSQHPFVAALSPLPLLLATLFTCQTAGTAQSPFRSLAVTLMASSALVRPLDVLMLASVIERQGVDKSSAVRSAFRQYYSREFSEREVEEMLVFSNKFEWSHKDLIKLCHIRPNSLTKSLLLSNRSNDQNNSDVTADSAQTRVRVLRSKESKPHEVVAVMDRCLLDPDHWPRALNTVFVRNAIIWRKLIENLSPNQLLAVVARVVNKFPNNKNLFELIVVRLNSREKSGFSSNFVKELVLFFLEKNVLKININLIQRLTQTISQLEIEKQFRKEITLCLDPKLKINRLYLSGLKDKKRQKEDLLDSMTVKDILQLLIKSFNCFLKSKQNSFIPFEAFDSLREPKEEKETEEEVGEEETETHLSAIVRQYPQQWRRRVIYVTDEQQDISQWEESSEKLIVFHVNRIDLKNLGFFRKNVLIFNGFDIRLEPIIAQFFAEEEAEEETTEERGMDTK